jgi:hypothetical protein
MAAIQNLFTAGNAVVIEIDVQSFADGIEASRVLVAGEPRHARRGPFRSNVVRRSKRRAVIDDRGAAETFAGQQSHAVIRRGGKATFRIKISKAAELRAVKIRVIVIAAGFENDYIFSSCRENGRGGAAACA